MALSGDNTPLLKHLMIQNPTSYMGVSQAVVSGGSSWENMRTSHASIVDLQHCLAQNVEAESNAFFAFMDSALRKVLPIPAFPLSHLSLNLNSARGTQSIS
jgi:hypothetical protein